jgi:peptide/nickel transport system substrate-binding protein
VREAAELAIDKQALIDGVFFGLGNPVAQPIPPNHWAYNPDIDPEGDAYGYNPERAKQLLAEAGYPDGVDFEMVIPGLDDHRAIAEAMLPMFEAVGFNVSTRVIESPTTPDTFFVRQEGDAFPGMGAPFADPSTLFLSNLPGAFANPWNTVSDEFNKAFQESLMGNSNEERLPAIQKMIAEDKDLRLRFALLHATPPSAWTDKAWFPEGYEPAYAPTLRGVGVTS